MSKGLREVLLVSQRAQGKRCGAIKIRAGIICEEQKRAVGKPV